MIVEGLVQGVGFRWFALSIANKYHLTGSVRNLDNGMVEIYVQGENEKIDLFIHDLYVGNRFCKVENISSKKTSIVEKEGSFTVKY